MNSTIEHPWRITARDAGPITLEKRDEGLPMIRGYGAVFFREGDPSTEFRLFDDFVERIMPGAFDRAIREDDVRGLLNHNPSELLGRTSAGTMKLAVDARGLIYWIDTPDTQLGRDLVVALERGDVSGSSFSFIARKIVIRETVDADGNELIIRELHDFKRLFDVGPVTFPAYEGTSAEAGRAAGNTKEAVDELAAWRDQRKKQSESTKRNAAIKRTRATVVKMQAAQRAGGNASLTVENSENIP